MAGLHNEVEHARQLASSHRVDPLGTEVGVASGIEDGMIRID